MNKEELEQKLLFWHPELTLAERNGYALLLEIDALNNHMYWYVNWSDGTYSVSRECKDFVEARDYFLEKIGEK